MKFILVCVFWALAHSVAAEEPNLQDRGGNDILCIDALGARVCVGDDLSVYVEDAK